MSVVCPAGVTRAPKATVWTLLTQPRLYPKWMDARPVEEWDRPIRTDDVVVLRANGTPFRVTWNVIDVDAHRYRLRLGIRLPLGVFNDETISVVSWSEDETLIRFY
jgi:hypothetical protein